MTSSAGWNRSSPQTAGGWPRRRSTCATRSGCSTAWLIDSFRRAGQGQVFAFYDRLLPDARARLLSEAAEIDLGEVDRLVRTLVAGGEARAVDLEGLAPGALRAPALARGRPQVLVGGEGGRRGRAAGRKGRRVHRGRRPGNAPGLRRPEGNLPGDARPAPPAVPGLRLRRSWRREGGTGGRSTGSS
jgi:hypothetical protein